MSKRGAGRPRRYRWKQSDPDRIRRGICTGEERKIHFSAVDLPHSDARLVRAYPAESSEAFCEGTFQRTKPAGRATGSPDGRASDAFAPCAVGLLSGSMIFSSSMIEPVQNEIEAPTAHQNATRTSI